MYVLESRGTVIFTFQSELLVTYFVFIHIDLEEVNIRVFLAEFLQARDTHQKSLQGHNQICMKTYTHIRIHTCTIQQREHDQ